MVHGCHLLEFWWNASWSSSTKMPDIIGWDEDHSWRWRPWPAFLGCLVALDVKLPSLQHLVGLQTRDDQHQFLYRARIEPLWVSQNKQVQHMKSRNLGIPKSILYYCHWAQCVYHNHSTHVLQKSNRGTFELRNHIWEVFLQVAVSSDQQAHVIVVNSGERLWRIDPTLVKDAVDAKCWDEKKKQRNSVVPCDHR